MLRGFTQDDLAELIGSLTSHGGKIERGKVFLKLSTLNAIATALKVEPTMLVSIVK